MKSHNFIANRWGKSGNSDRFYFLELQNQCGSYHTIKRWLNFERKAMAKLDSILKAGISLCWQRSVFSKLQFSSSQVQMWELDHNKDWVLKTWCFWALKNWCFWIAVLEKALESPLDRKEIKTIYPKGNDPWIFIGRIDVEAEAPLFWPPDAKNLLTGKDHDAGKDWRQKQKMAADYWMVWYHHQFSGHELF